MLWSFLEVFYGWFNENLILLDFEIAINLPPPSFSFTSSSPGYTKTAGLSVADSSMLTLIKLQSICAKCQETQGSSAI